MTKHEFILTLLRSALWQQPLKHFDMTPWEYKAVMEEAEKQCVQGLIIDCLQFNNMGLQKRCVIHMMQMRNALIAENKKLNDNIIRLSELFEQQGIEYAIVKGQTLGVLYPKPELRIPGDIDFYVPEEYFQKGLKVFANKWNIIREEYKENDKHLEFKWNGSSFEMHHFLIRFFNNKNRKYFNTILKNSSFVYTKVNNKNVKTLEPALNIYFTFCHLYHHFRSQGIALRQLCDLAILINSYKGQPYQERLQTILEKTGYTKAFKAIASILTEKLGLSTDNFPFIISEKDKNRGEKILKDVWLYGNWGNYGLHKYQNYTFAHRLEIGKITISHVLRFYHLSPKENTAVLLKSITKLGYKSIKKALPWFKSK